MSRNKIDFNQKSKLSTLLDNENSEKNINIHPSFTRSQPARVKSFRLREVDIQNMNNTVERINMGGKIQPIHSGDLIKGLLLMGTQMSEDKIVNFIKMSY